MADTNPVVVPGEGLARLTHVMYGLHAFSALMGILGPALVVTAFLTGWPSIIAVILNFVKRPEARGTWLDSHFSWQMRTFWFAVLWSCVGWLFFITVVGIFFAWGVWVATGLWVIYRVIRGWIALADAKPMPA